MKQDINVICKVRVFRATQESKDGHPDLLLAQTISTSATADRKQDINVLNRVLFSSWSVNEDSRPDLWLTETQSTWLQPLNGIQQNLTWIKISMSSTTLVFLRADCIYKMAAPTTNWRRHFRLLLYNCWMEFNDTLQNASTQQSLQCLCFWTNRIFLEWLSARLRRPWYKSWWKSLVFCKV